MFWIIVFNSIVEMLQQVSIVTGASLPLKYALTMALVCSFSCVIMVMIPISLAMALHFFGWTGRAEFRRVSSSQPSAMTDVLLSLKDDSNGEPSLPLKEERLTSYL